MTRNQLIKIVGTKIHAMRAVAARSDCPNDWSKLGAFESFVNDLCNAPSKHNRERGHVCYTLREAARRFKELCGN